MFSSFLNQRYHKWPLAELFIGVTLLFAASCGDDGDDSGDAADTTPDSAENQQGLDPDNIPANTLAEPITMVDCVLTDGSQTTCYNIVITGSPTHDAGPFCPAHISDGADAGGAWIDNGEVYDVTGAFIENLATFYDDDSWLVYDVATGDVNRTEGPRECAITAQPTEIPEELHNHCIDCQIDYVQGGVEATFLIPVEPVPLDSPGEILEVGNVGLSFNGVAMAAPAPIESIISNNMIAAFDDCLAHVSLLPGLGYHYHGAAGCGEEVAQSDGHSALFGYARDGYGIYAQLDSDGNEPNDLDECRGHVDNTRGYHYHSAGPGENMFIGCFHGAQALAP